MQRIKIANHIYSVLKNMCWLFAVELLMLAIFILGSILDSAVIFVCGLYGGMLTVVIGTAIAVGLGLMRPTKDTVKKHAATVILGAFSTLCTLLGILQTYLVLYRAARCWGSPPSPFA